MIIPTLHRISTAVERIPLILATIAMAMAMMETIFLPTKDRIVVYHLMAHTTTTTTTMGVLDTATATTTMGVLDPTPATMGVLVIIAVYQ